MGRWDDGTRDKHWRRIVNALFGGAINMPEKGWMRRLHFLRVFCRFINRFSHATECRFWWCECFVVILQSSGVGMLVASGRKNGEAWWLCWKVLYEGESIRRTLQGDGRNWKLWVLSFCKLRVKRGGVPAGAERWSRENKGVVNKCYFWSAWAWCYEASCQGNRKGTTGVGKQQASRWWENRRVRRSKLPGEWEGAASVGKQHMSRWGCRRNQTGCDEGVNGGKVGFG